MARVVLLLAQHDARLVQKHVTLHGLEAQRTQTLLLVRGPHVEGALHEEAPLVLQPPLGASNDVTNHVMRSRSGAQNHVKS